MRRIALTIWLFISPAWAVSPILNLETLHQHLHTLPAQDRAKAFESNMQNLQKRIDHLKSREAKNPDLFDLIRTRNLLNPLSVRLNPAEPAAQLACEEIDQEFASLLGVGELEASATEELKGLKKIGRLFCQEKKSDP